MRASMTPFTFSTRHAKPGSTRSSSRPKSGHPANRPREPPAEPFPNPHFVFPGLKKKARIEIIPLIDVIFFLLATFVLFTLSLDKIASIPVQLPQAVDNPNSKPDENMLSIQVSDQGTIYWKIGTLTAPELITA